MKSLGRTLILGTQAIAQRDAAGMRPTIHGIDPQWSHTMQAPPTL